MADLTVQKISRAGVDPAGGEVAAAAGGDAFINDGKTFLRVNNAGAGAVVVTFTAQNTSVRPTGPFGVITVADIVVTVGAGLVREIGPIPQGIFNDGNGKVQVTYDQVTSVTVAARKVPVGE